MPSVGHRKGAPPCAFCGKLAEFLCDQILGWEPQPVDYTHRVPIPKTYPGQPRPYTREERVQYTAHRTGDEDGNPLPPFTCDLPVCQDCRQPMRIHLNRAGRCEWIEEDFCPLHQPGWTHRMIGPLTAAEAEDWRERAFAEAAHA